MKKRSIPITLILLPLIVVLGVSLLFFQRDASQSGIYKGSVKNLPENALSVSAVSLQESTVGGGKQKVLAQWKLSSGDKASANFSVESVKVKDFSIKSESALGNIENFALYEGSVSETNFLSSVSRFSGDTALFKLQRSLILSPGSSVTLVLTGDVKNEASGKSLELGIESRGIGTNFPEVTGLPAKGKALEF